MNKFQFWIAMALVLSCLLSCKDDVRPGRGLTILNDCDPCELQLYTDLLLEEQGIRARNFTVLKRGIFAYWWDSKYDIESEIPPFAAQIEAIHEDLKAYGVGDPGAFQYGYYTNIYIHRGDEDAFPDFFGNGTGFEGDDEGQGISFSYLSYPYDEDMAQNKVNLYHEVFHIMQGAAYDKGVLDGEDEAPDGIWAIEGFAEWYQMSRVGDTEVRSFENVYAISASPDLALWQFGPRKEIPEGSLNEAQQEGIDYVFGIRQYSNGAFFHHLTELEGVEDRALLDAMYLSYPNTPQAHLFNNLDAEALRSHYADWAAQNTADFAYLKPEQLAFAKETYQSFAEDMPDGHEKPYVVELTGSNSVGTYSPEALYRPMAWGYNVMRITQPGAARYTFDLQGDPSGSEGGTAHFEARVVIKDDMGDFRFEEVSMDDATQGRISIETVASDREIRLVIASVPAVLTGGQTFGYSVDIGRE